MSRKRFFALITSFALVATLAAPLASAEMTAEQMQALIAQLTAQVQQLQSQLQALTGAPAPTVPAISGIPADFTFQTNLRLGSTGNDVKYLQIVLNADPDTRLAASGIGSPGQETSYFGPLTQAAVIKFQEKYANTVLAPHGITRGTGFVGTTTRAKLNDILLTATEPDLPDVPDVPDEPDYPDVPDDPDDPADPDPVVTPMSVKLSDDTPVSANVWRGSANNTVTKLHFQGGETAQTITGLTLTNYGTTEATGTGDISAVKIFDEDNVQLGANRTIAGNMVSFVFVPGFTVPANGSRTLSVAVNVGSGATVMSQIRLGVASAAAISGATFTGNFPIAGNSFTIVPAGSAGSVSVSKFGTVPRSTVRIGEKDAVLHQFSIAAGSNEDIKVSQIAIVNHTSATISDSDITNLRIKEVGGAVVSGSTNLVNRKATFNFPTPITFTKGTSRNYQVIADIATGNGRRVRLELEAGAVVAQGVSSGIGIASTGTTSYDNVAIDIGGVVVNMSPNHPQGADAMMIKTSDRMPIARFSVRARGEDVILNTINLSFTATCESGTDLGGSANATSIPSVGLYDGDALISDLRDITTTADHTFSTNWTIPAGETRDLTVRGVLNGFDWTNGDPNGDPFVVTTTLAAFSGFGLASGESLSSSSASATSINVYPEGTIARSVSTTQTPYSQGIRNPSNNVLLGALRLFPQREDQKLTKLVIDRNGAGITSLALYSSDGTQLSSLVPVSTDTDTFTFEDEDLLDDIVFSRNKYETILLRGNVGSTVADQFLKFKEIETLGMSSGEAIDEGTDLNLKFTSPYDGGTFELSPRIVEMEKHTTSPSGQLSRGTQTTTGVWTLTNADAGLASVEINTLKFTSKTGLPSTNLVDSEDGNIHDAALFHLYDGEGNKVSSDTVKSLVAGDGTITFSGLEIEVLVGEPKTLKLVVDTTSTAKWPSATQIHWTVDVVRDAVITTGAWGSANATFTTTWGSATVAVGDQADFPPGTIGRTDSGAAYWVIDRTETSGPGDITVYPKAVLSESGTSEVDKKAAAVGYLGWGGTIWSIPADANIVSLP